MSEFRWGSLRCVVEHEGDVADADRAAVLRIEAAGDASSWLRFVCWTDPARSYWEASSGEHEPTPPGVDSLDWMLGELRAKRARLGRAGRPGRSR